jgi:hypothetical protein
LVPGRLSAQAADDTQERLKALEDRIRVLEAEIQTLKAAQATSPAPQAPATVAPPPPDTITAQVPAGTAGAPSQPLPVYGGRSVAGKVLNPDIGVIGNFIGAAGYNRTNPFPALSLQESEVSLQAIVDPFARADFFLAVGEQGIEVEEGYVTFPAIPGGFVAKVGKMRATFGRVNMFHNHSLPWVDRPLVTFNLMGGSLEEADVGIKDAGISVSRILPAPRGIFLEATGEVFRGDSGTLFQSSRRSDLSVIGHLGGYGDFTDSTNLEVGASYARGHNDLGGDFTTQLFGMDGTLRWKPLRRAIYRSFTARTELIWGRREQLFETSRAFGLYASGEYRLNRRWTVAGRYDRSDRARIADLTDDSFSGVLTYWPSEFNQIRAQLRRTRYAQAETANELIFQFLFTLGAHGAHPF